MLAISPFADLHSYYVLAGTMPVLVHNEGGVCPVTGAPHGAMGQDASLARLQSEGCADSVSEPQFMAADGTISRADFMARGPDGVIHVIDSMVTLVELRQIKSRIP